MLFSFTLFVVDSLLIGLWLRVVAKWTGLRFPLPDVLITAALCSAPAVLAALGTRLVFGWLLGLIILALIAVRMEDADFWPELTLMIVGTLAVWIVTYEVLMALLS